MKRLIFAKVVGCLALAAWGTASADGAVASQGQQLFKSKFCYACHHETQQRVGPPLQAIAIRYSMTATTARQVLPTKIILGGAGAWGYAMMVPNEHVSMEEARVLTDWILSLTSPQ